MTSIAILPESSRTILRSTTVLTTIPQIIHELVQNSLDAGASQIDIGVNLDLWQCWVRDNGHGIDRKDMSVLAQGGEKGRYGTSKAHDDSSLNSVSTLGFRGEALASAADVSVLEIASRTTVGLETWSIILKGGESLYHGPAMRWKRERAGTTVVVRDAFYNLPVRRRTHTNTSRTFELIRKDLECTALVFPQVVFSLENSAKEQSEGSGKGKILNIPKTNSSLATFRHLFGKSLCENFEEINAKEGDICIQGFLGLEGIHTKLHQYIYLNKQLLSPCELHRTVDSRFASSSFGRHALEADADRLPKPVLRRSPRKNERRPIYVLSIMLPSRLVDNCLEPTKASVNLKDSNVLCKILDKIIHSFLNRNGFASSSLKRTLDDPSNVCSKRYRVKETAEPSAIVPAKSKPEPHSSSAHNVSFIEPFCVNREQPQWADATGPVYPLDLKTKTDSYSINERRQMILIDGDNIEESNQLRIYVNTGRPEQSGNRGQISSKWIQDTLAAWKNPTFGFGENDIRSLSSSASKDNPSTRTRCTPLADTEFVTAISSNFNKTQLQDAEIIGQVDKKFIACIIKNASVQEAKETLILVDQHAADERVRVERFLSEVCLGFLKHDSSVGIETSHLDPPIPVLLNKFEAKAFRDNGYFLKAFARWGFGLELAMELNPEEEGLHSAQEYCQVFVGEVPKILVEKLLTGDELREFIKGYLARLTVEGADSHLFKANSNNNFWTSALRWCPRELIDLVNSKACRGAIMFNDDLNLDECRQLISRLSGTVWPFMCAHGRPSLIPLAGVELEGNMTNRTINWSKLEIS